MKTRYIATLLTASLLLALAACGDDDPIVIDQGTPNNEANNDVNNDAPNNDTPNNDVNNDVNNAPNNDAPNNDLPNNDPNNDLPNNDPNNEQPPLDELTVEGGDVSGSWCGQISVQGSVRIPEGQALEICAGSTVTVSDAQRFNMEVDGELRILGTSGLPVTLTAPSRWVGLVVTGSLVADHVDITRAELAVRGLPSSQITMRSSTITQDGGQSLNLGNGGTFERVTIIGGNAISVSGGMLQMTDSVIDFQHPEQTPDCTKWDGGGAILDHVRFTGCHCPLHFNRTTEEVTITNSIFDGAAFPAMVANMTGTFTNNHFLGGFNHILDIGGNFNIDIAGNYYDGGAPSLGTDDASQFRNAGDFLTEPVPGVGPR